MSLDKAIEYGKEKRKPTVPEVAPLVWAYKDKGNLNGGCLHIVLCDPNFEDHHVKYCLETGESRSDFDGVSLAKVLLKMSKSQRRRLYDLFYANADERAVLLSKWNQTNREGVDGSV